MNEKGIAITFNNFKSLDQKCIRMEEYDEIKNRKILNGVSIAKWFLQWLLLRKKENNLWFYIFWECVCGMHRRDVCTGEKLATGECENAKG